MDSVYTDISPSRCKMMSLDRESGSSVQHCPGVAGYSLLVLDDDARQSITVIAPDGTEYPLDYWDAITPTFSTLGEKAEWRVKRQNGKPVPIALIVRVNAIPDASSSERKASYLAVAKITPQRICVTDKVGPGRAPNEAARRAADASVTKPCLRGSVR